MTGESRASRVTLENAHAARLERVETELVAARREAVQLDLTTSAIDRALLALGSQALKRTSDRLPTSRSTLASEALACLRPVLQRADDQDRRALLDVERLLLAIGAS